MGMAIGWLAWIVLGKNKALTKDRKPNYGVLLVLGVAGSILGAVVASLLTGQGFGLQFGHMIASFLGAVVAVAAYVAVKTKK
jgi:uncharacterized membrane protein YeaQ/YmgE (transglycosylase-associated protein family)